MKTLLLALSCAALCAGGAAKAQDAAAAPMTLVHKIPIPGAEGGEFDHLVLDKAGQRLFVSDEGHHTVDVIDTRTNTVIRVLGQGVIHTPHSMVYRADLDRLFVADGDEKIGAVRIYDGKTYALIKSIDLPPLADWSSYDAATKRLYVSGMGYVIHKPDSTVSVVDTTTGELASQFTVPDAVVTGFTVDPSNANLYIGLRIKNVIAVVDRNTHQITATWPVSGGTGLGSAALDVADHRLFENTRSGQTLVFDTRTGQEVSVVPINTFSDDFSWDPATRRFFITAKGAPKAGHPTVEVFQQLDPDHYKSLGEVATLAGARTGILSAEAGLFYVGAPKSADGDQQVLVYAVR